MNCKILSSPLCCVCVRSTKQALGDHIILSDPELHTLRLHDNMLFAVAVSDGITNKLSDETIVNQVGSWLLWHSAVSQ